MNYKVFKLVRSSIGTDSNLPKFRQTKKYFLGTGPLPQKSTICAVVYCKNDANR